MDEVERAGKARKHTQGPYQWAMYENWERLKQHYGDNPRELLDPLTTNNDTALNLVAFAGRKDVLEFLISLIKEAPQLHRALRMENGQGNTTLHEVAASGNLDAAMLLVRLDNRVRAELARLDLDRNGADDEACYRPVVEIRNQMGETPLYRAAAFGHTKLVKYLVSQVEDIEPHLLQIHKLSILYIAVIGHHFGISNGDDTIDWVPPNQNDDLESRINRPWQSSCSKKIKRWPRMRMKSEEMQKQKALLELTHLLVEKDYSWVENKKTNDVPIFTVPSQEENAISGDDDGEEEESKSIHHNDTPLFIATSTGISQIVKKMLELHPQSVEAHDVDNQQNILHMAVKHRRLEIFKLVKKSKSVTSRMAMKIDRDGNTLLHQAAYMEYYSTNTQRVGGPALQLQQELRWMVRVQKIMPRHYTMHHNRKGMTAEELFNSEHAKLLQSAQEWMKGTAQSCSTVAALVATVVYAAAYTAPGGYDSNGLPLLRNSGFFVTFAITDTVSLISSLASLVTFLSILTSPFEYQDFYRSLPFRLHLGFTLLFFSLVTTMLTFTATIVLLIHLRKKWTTSLIYVVAFLPVPMLGLMQLPLYKGFSQGLKYILKKIRKIKFSICPARGS
ncbi:hypothetical protein CerSpe_270490 [Prunus speciosa]